MAWSFSPSPTLQQPWPVRSLKLTTAATSRLNTLQNIKDSLKIDSTNDDVLLSTLNIAAESYLESVTGRAFINQTWTLQCEGFLADVIELPMAPLNTISSVLTFNTANSSATFITGLYSADTQSEPGRIFLDLEASYPAALRDVASYRVKYVAGYGSTSSSVPSGIRQVAQTAVKGIVKHWFECGGSDTQLPATVAPLVGILKVHRF